MSKREKLRAQYIEGWYAMDADKLFSSVANNFIFDDPAEPGPITKDMLADYMVRWNEMTTALGGNNEWILNHEVREDRDGVLTDWEWWEIVGTELCGAAFVLTSDEGVFLERITYFNRRRLNRYP